MAKLYLIPTILSESQIEQVIPQGVAEIIRNTKVFIVENLRTARRYLKMVDKSINIDQLTFFEMSKHSDPREYGRFLMPLSDGFDIGIISEAGCPAIADPGALIVDLAQRKGIDVVPLVGPSSILLSLMASGLNGQSFSFHGYLPIGDQLRTKTIKELETISKKLNQTQIFIETPFRNDKLFETIVNYCLLSTKLCIACNITANDEYIKTKTIKEWKIQKPDINKKPTIFLILG